MVRRFASLAGLFVMVAALGACFSLNQDENIRMINTWGDDAHDMRQLTNKYFFNYDHTDPFADY